MATLNTTANLTQITAPRVPLIDERTGLVSREWYRFFLSLYNLTGSGQNNTTLTDLQVGPPPAQQEDLTGLVVNIELLKTQPNQESALEQISELEKQIQGLATAMGCACNEVAAELQKQIDALNVLPLPNISASLTSGTSILYGNGSGGFNNVAIGSGISFSGGTLSATGTGGTVTNVAALTLGTTGTDLSSTVATSTTTPVITLNVPTASAANRGALSAADWATFNSKQAAGTYVNSVGGTAPVVSSGGTAPVISLAANYGDTQNPYASKTANFVLAAPNGGSGNPTFRAIVAADIPTLNQNTTGNAATVTTNANLTGAVTSVGNATSLGLFTSAQLATALTDETGTGANVFATSPTLVTPALGTPSSGIVTNLTGTASININGTVGSTTAAAGSFTTLTSAGIAVTGAISATTGANFATTSGNVGVGTASPGAKLEVNGGASVSRILLTDTVGQGARTKGQVGTTGSDILFSTIGAFDDVSALIFRTTQAVGSITEQMRIDNLGNVGIGTAAPAHKLQVAGGNIRQANAAATSTTRIANVLVALGSNGNGADGCLQITDAVANNVYFGQNLGGAYVVSNSNGVRLSSGGTSWASDSDERLKVMSEWEPITDASAKIVTLRTGVCRYKTDAVGTRRAFLIAQDVQQVQPEAIDVQGDADQTLGIRYTEVIPLMIAAIQEQQALIESLTTRLTALEGSA